jgi:uncharacterized membrane protein YfcA
MDFIWVVPIAGLGSAVIGFFVGSTSLGGFLLVPLLLIGTGVAYVQAVSIALLAMLPGGILAAIVYVRQRRYSWQLSLHLLAAGLPGLYLGLYLSQTISSSASQRIFGVFLLVVTGLLVRSLLTDARKRELKRTSTNTLSYFLVITALGLLAGVASTLAGVGGAIIFIPALLALGMDPEKAVGTGIVASVFIAGIGAIGHWVGLSDPPLLISVVVTAGFLIGALLGAKTSALFPEAVLKWLITVLCCASAVYFLLKSSIL